MKMVQRWVSIFLSAAILLTLVVCGSVYVLSITPVDAASPVGAFMNPQIENVQRSPAEDGNREGSRLHRPCPHFPEA